MRPRGRKQITFGFMMLVLFILAGMGVFMVAMQQIAVSNDVKSRRVEKSVAAEKTRQKSLRLELARLKSPGRIARIAQDELGFCEPGAVIYLKYSRDGSGNVACQSTFERISKEPPKKPGQDQASVGEEPAENLTRR